MCEKTFLYFYTYRPVLDDQGNKDFNFLTLNSSVTHQGESKGSFRLVKDYADNLLRPATHDCALRIIGKLSYLLQPTGHGEQVLHALAHCSFAVTVTSFQLRKCCRVLQPIVGRSRF